MYTLCVLPMKHQALLLLQDERLALEDKIKRQKQSIQWEMERLIALEQLDATRNQDHIGKK